MVGHGAAAPMTKTRATGSGDLGSFHPCTKTWFTAAFAAPTSAQQKGWPAIVAGDSTLLLAPTGSGKTLAAFLVAIDRLCFQPRAASSAKAASAKKTKTKRPRDERGGVRVLYISPLKALGVDVERNLRAPLAGIRAVAAREGIATPPVTVAVRSGDTPQRERQAMRRHPPDVLITTPESLYLMLTSQAREILASVETVIIDEIHSVAPSKRGSHLALSLERLEALRRGAAQEEEPSPLQRIGLSATQRPLEEIARFLGGFADGQPRPVTIVDAGSKKDFAIHVEVPVADMAKMVAAEVTDEGEPTTTNSIWPAIHPRLVELIRAHKSTMIFVNSRRLAERLALAINELAEEEIARAHHGSVAKDIRALIEEQLKRGELPAMVATSSLELGIDIGAVDLVIQVEAPPSVASAIQRIGRAGHQVGAVSEGRVFPKYRHDLLACAAVVEHVHAGNVERTRYPRNPIDVLAQQVVAMVVDRDEVAVDDLFEQVRGAAPYAELPRRSFDGVLDMLSGRYPSERFGELRPRLTFDRIAGTVRARRGAKMLAIANGGTIPDRGLYGVFLAGGDAEGKTVRVGELDEEMVFESRQGDIFLLGASSWRIEEITQNQVLVSPAPGQPGRMPFWHGDRPGRPIDFGKAIGKLARELQAMPTQDAVERLEHAHGLDALAAENLVRYLADQVEATAVLPSDRHIVVERFRDEIGDWVVTVMTPFGTPVHAPWATAVNAQLLREHGIDADVVWGDDGMVFRLPDVDNPPDDALFFPDPADVESLVTNQLGETALFASRFRENAGRALLLPRRRPGQRTPLWAQRRKSARLLGVASEFRDFPIVLETYRECLQDVFDLPSLVELLTDVRDRRIKVRSVESRTPSPFASALLFSYVANFMYEGDAPLAERRAQALTLDHAQLRALLGEPELRELLDADAIVEVEAQLQMRNYAFRPDADSVHDLLLALGDLTAEDVAARLEADADASAETRLGAAQSLLEQLVERRRIAVCSIGDRTCYVAMEDIARYRDALGVVPPGGTPPSLLLEVPDALGELVGRYARTHGPFTAQEIARRLGLGVGPVKAALGAKTTAGRLLEGEFLPMSVVRARGLSGREFCDPDVLRRIKRRSLARLRAEVEPVEPEAYARFLVDWHGVRSPTDGVRGGSSDDAILDVVERLQGAPIAASVFDAFVFGARIPGYDPRDLDALCARGDLLWRGFQSLGGKDGRIALYLPEHYGLLAPACEVPEGPLCGPLVEHLGARGATFFRELVDSLRRPATEVLEALWDLVWAGVVTNDTFAPLRSLGAKQPTRRGRRGREVHPGSEGRWSLLPSGGTGTPTERAEAQVQQLLERHGVIVREIAKVEHITGGFSAIYPVLKAMEEAGRVRRGYFVEGLGATQFALPGCEDRLRRHRDLEPAVGAGKGGGTRGKGGAEDRAGAGGAVVLAAEDPANPWGASLSWPTTELASRPRRDARSRVVLFQGALIAVRTADRLLTFLPDEPKAKDAAGRALAETLARGFGVRRGRRGGAGVVLREIDEVAATKSALAPFFVDAGFQPAGSELFRRT